MVRFPPKGRIGVVCWGKQEREGSSFVRSDMIAWLFLPLGCVRAPARVCSEGRPVINFQIRSFSDVLPSWHHQREGRKGVSSLVLLQSGAESLILSFSLFLISREARINLCPQSPSVWEGGEGGGSVEGKWRWGERPQVLFRKGRIGPHPPKKYTHICVGFHSDCVCVGGSVSLLKEGTKGS